MLLRVFDCLLFVRVCCCVAFVRRGLTYLVLMLIMCVVVVWFARCCFGLLVVFVVYNCALSLLFLLLALCMHVCCCFCLICVV